ncbi:MAG TPA: MFS transporter [Vicinamibacterales bacterium]|nr:MFS transporter [Vicinamibacterales bacterium]
MPDTAQQWGEPSGYAEGFVSPSPLSLTPAESHDTAAQSHIPGWLPYVSGAFGLAVSGQVNFLVPLRASELGASFEMIGLIVGAGAAAPALLSVTTGAVIDRLGARRTFLLGTAATAALAAASVLVTVYWWFLVLQPLIGISRNLGWLASQTYISSLGSGSDRHRNAGRFSFFTSAGQMAAPVMIGTVAQFTGFRWAFLFLSAYAAAFAAVALFLPDVGSHPPPAGGRGRQGTGLYSALQLLKLRPLQVVLLISGLRLWITWIYTPFIPIHLTDNGLSPAVIGIVLATYGIVAAAIAPTMAFWTRFASAATVATVAMGCGAIALLIAPHLTSVPLVFLPPALIGIGQGLSLPVILTIIGEAAPAGRRGVALGMRAAVNQTAAAIAPVIVGALIAASGVVAAFTTGAAGAAALVAAARLLHVTPTASAAERA